MTDTVEINYFRCREKIERETAGRTASGPVSDAHFMLAERYADRVYSLEEGWPQPNADRDAAIGTTTP